VTRALVPDRVSVVVATYNGQRWISDTLQSVLVQTWPDVQIIVCDDGSTDGTRELLDRFDERIEVLLQDNAGVSAARNHGAQLATGRWLAFLDHDDLWEPDMLERQVTALAARPDAELVYADSHIIDDHSVVHGQRSSWLDFREGDVQAELLLGNFITIETVVMRTACFRKLGGFDESLRYLEDYELFLRISARGPVVFQPEPVARYRIHGSNLSRQHEALLGEWVEVLERLGSGNGRRPVAEQALIEGERARRAGEVAWAALRRGDVAAADAWIARAGERCPAALHRKLITWRALMVGLPAPLSRSLRRLLPRRRLYGV
jgi:glycosyltransferase involved in cell wall biosynthesis